MLDALATQSTSFAMKQQDSMSKVQVKQPELDNSRGCAADDEECIRNSQPPKIEAFSNFQYPTSWLTVMAVSFAAFVLLTRV
jgi:hypothetical protein